MIFAIGLDIGTHTAGYAAIRYFDTKEVPELVDCGCCKVSKSLPLAQRLSELRRDLSTVISGLIPDLHTEIVVGIEKPFVHPARHKGAIETGAGFGIALEVTASIVGPLGRIIELAPATVKKEVAGDGRAEKNEVRAAVMRIMNIETWPADPLDVSDAIAIALTAAFKGCAADEEQKGTHHA